VSAAPAEREREVTKFESTTTARASYLAWPMPAKHGRKKPPVASVNIGWGNGMAVPTSSYRDMFREITLPEGAPAAIGVQVAGGAFHVMMPRGTRAPARKKLMFTTTEDQQSSIDVIVIAQGNDSHTGRKLGHFTIDGIAPTHAGLAQVEVSLNLGGDNSLRVSAVDCQGNRTRSLTVKDKIRLG